MAVVTLNGKNLKRTSIFQRGLCIGWLFRALQGKFPTQCDNVDCFIGVVSEVCRICNR